jgi:phage/plasmid-associated DNA primase
MNINNSNCDYDSEIEEHTVETKLIHEHKKNSNVLNKLYNNNNEKYKQLNDYLIDYKLTKDSKQESNITIPGEARFYIPEYKQYRFFEKLKECAKEKLILHFCERQFSDFYKDIGSGIMFDFDLLQESDKNTLHEKPFDTFIKKIFMVMKELIDYDEDIETYVAVITKQKLVYKEEYKLYKNGFHILIPGIKLTREAKKLIYHTIIDNDDIKKFFLKNFENKIGEVFDKGSYSVPVYYMYNCKNNSNNPYDLFNMYKVNIDDSVSVSVANKERILNTYNIIIELSLNHPGDMINKKFYKLKDEYQLKISNELESSKARIEKEDQLKYAFDTENTYIDENLEYYNKLVIDILDEKRANDRNMWRDVVYALANINPGNPGIFKNIAERFSMRCYSKYDEVAFDKLWDEAINYNGTNKYNLGSLIRWAKEDNLKKYNRLSEKNIIQTIKYDVFESENKVLNGSLFQYHFAYYIYHLFKEKFVCDVSNNQIAWYEFVLDKDSHIKGEVYKWREENKPDNLYKYISSKLPNKISSVITEAEDYIKNHPENTNTNEFLQHRIQKLRTSAQKLYTTDFKKGILKEAEVLFRKRGFLQSLDTDQNIMGVGNGILELSDNPKLIRHYHDYPISLYTDIDYEAYDKNNPFIQTVIDGVFNLFPDDEKDAFHYLMYYLASCLDGKPKDSMILIITGTGCHAKDSLIRMYDGSIKKVQDININDQLMGDDNTPRIVQELFRGRDTMVKIKPTKEKSFIVNINHILSLKFTNLISIIKRNDGYYKDNESYRIIWYEYNGINEPKRKSKTLKSKKLCNEFKINLLNNKKVIQKGDIIDIKVKDILTWNPWWMKKGNVNLYKSEKLTYNLGYWLGDGTSCRMQIYGNNFEHIPCKLIRKQSNIRIKNKNPNLDSFSIEILNEDDYYGFELDKNHRYITADGFIHHNSNGKSFLAEMIKSVLGTYGKKMPLSFLTDSRGKSSGADPALMDLKTARLAYYSESNKDEVLNTAKLKEVTSQETLSGRGLFEKQSQFRPVCHHMVTTNYSFSIKTTDHGIWRRIVTYEFKMIFTSNPDPNNKYEKKENTRFAQEFTYNPEIKKAFLSILVEYYRDLHKNHGGSLKNIMKPTIDKETSEYRNKEDIINRFIDDVCIYSEGNKTCISELIDKYENWHEYNVDKSTIPIKSEIRRQLLNSKIIKYVEKTQTNIILKNIRIKEDSFEDDLLSDKEYFIKDLSSSSPSIINNKYDISKFNPLNIN